MAPRFRFKHLESRGIDLSTEPWRRPPDEPWYEQLRDDAPDPPPHAIDAQDGEGTLEEIVALLQARRLAREDLVDLGRGWETIEDTPELGELAQKLPRRPALDSLSKFLLGTFALSMVVGVISIFVPGSLGGWLVAFTFWSPPAAVGVALLWGLFAMAFPRPRSSGRFKTPPRR